MDQTEVGARAVEGPMARQPGVIQHNRQRAKPPMYAQTEAAIQREVKQNDGALVPKMSREQVSKAYDILEQQRIGPYFVKYGCISSVGLIAYTYLRGFYHLAQKNRDAWVGTFRHRIFILGPVIAMYATGNGIIPLPYKEQVEAALNRPAICMYDIASAKELVRKAEALPFSAQV